MVSILWDIFSRCSYRWLAPIIVATLTVLFLFPQKGDSVEIEAPSDRKERITDILSEDSFVTPNRVIDKFDKLEKDFLLSGDPLTETRILFQSFINEINFRYGFALSVQEAYDLIKKNIHTLNISSDVEVYILGALELLEFGSNQHFQMLIEERNHEYEELNRFYWPWEWNWFGLNKQNKEKRKDSLLPASLPILSGINPVNNELPANCYFGAIELLSGPLVALLPIPGSGYVAGVMISDGVVLNM